MPYQPRTHRERSDAPAAQRIARIDGRLTDSLDSEAAIAHLIVISGPSGAGKGTLIAAAMARLPGLKLSVSATTRAKRGGELEGRDYFFLTRDEFMKRARSGLFLEWAEYAGNLYGTPKQAVEEDLLAGRDVILEIELKGAEQVLGMRPDAVMIYIMPPTLEKLEERLRGRNTECEDDVRSRLASAEEEIEVVREKEREGLPRMHYVIVNNSVDRASAELALIIEKVREEDEQAYSR